jgi:hypothetical protein
VGDTGSNILNEHFWFTATTLAVNAFLISATIQGKYSFAARVAVSTLISVYAAYLIVQRSAGAAGKIRFPEDLMKIPADQKTFRHKSRETWHTLRIVPSHLLFVVCELSGSFFYLLLVLASCVAVWLICPSPPAGGVIRGY